MPGRVGLVLSIVGITGNVSGMIATVGTGVFLLFAVCLAASLLVFVLSVLELIAERIEPPRNPPDPLFTALEEKKDK